MRLVWVVIPLVLFGIIGIPESFATEEWEIIETGISLVEYEFPLQAGYGGNIDSEDSLPTSGHVSFTISKLPKLGETAELEFTFTNSVGGMIYANGLQYLPLNMFDSESFMTITISDNFEIVDDPRAETYVDKSGVDHTYIRELITPLALDESFTITTTVKAVSEGYVSIKGYSFGEHERGFKIQVTGNETLLYEDYIKKYPQEIEQTNNTDEPEPTPPPTVVINVSPKKQVNNGMLPENVICNGELKLIFKSSDNSPACVKPQTAEKLIERGWALDLGDEPNFSVYQTTPSRYYVDDEPNYSEILEIIKSIPEGNAFILKNTYLLEIYEHRSKFSSITVDNDSITLSASGGYTAEYLTIYTLLGLPVQITYSCWTDTAGKLIIESNILEILEKSSCEMKLRESIQR